MAKHTGCRIVAIGCLLIAAARGFASGVLDSWIAEAMEKNPEVLAARQNWEAARQRVPMEKSLMDPMLSADFMRADSTRFSDYDMIEWMVSQRVPWFGKRGARADAAALQAEAAGFEYLEAIRSVRARVVAAHWDLWLARETVEVSRENLAFLEQFEQAARARYESEPGGQQDLLRAQIERAKMSNEIVTLELEAQVVAAAVNALLNAPPAAARDVPAADLEIPAGDLPPEQLLERARTYNAALLARARRADAGRAAWRAAKLEYAPDLEFRVEARQPRGTGGIQEYDTMVGLNIPWLWAGKYRGMIREALAESEMAEAMYRAALNDLAVDIQAAYTKADAARRVVRLYDSEVLATAKQLVETTRAAYQTGQSTFFELTDALRAYLDARLQYLRAKADHGRAAAELQRMAAPFGDFEKGTGALP